jgi:hypothetical protein
MTANTGERENRDIPREYPEGPGDVPADTWAARLVLSRYHAGRLSIEKAAERCGINPGNWVRWENGRPRAKDPIRPIRRVVDRTQPVAV